MAKIYGKKQSFLNVRVMVLIALLSAIAFVLSLDGVFRWRLPLFPPFLILDVSDIPALIGAITLGPIAGVHIVALGNILDVLMTGTTTMGIGPFTNFLAGTAYILPTAYIHNRFGSNLKSFLVGAGLGVLFATITVSLIKMIIMIPIYAYIFGIPIDNIVAMGTMVNSSIDSLATLVLFSIVPFNILKFSLVSIGGFVVIKAFNPLMVRFSKK
ncbi:MAG: ECF transporter S component [Defluviitaleaceae bacterium]|nr:ECF transporter S component [Defluviitaleaceae bacterium]